MKSSILSLAVAALLIQSVAPAVAQDSTPSSQTIQPEKPKTDKKRLFKAGAIGCGMGALVGLLTRQDKRGALVGCAAGAVVGSVASYKKQLNEAHELAAQAEAAGMTAVVSTKQVQATSGEATEALDQVVIAYDPASMSSRDPKTIAVLDRIAALAKKSKEPLSIAAEGKTKACQVPLAELSARGVFPPAKAIDRCGSGKNRLVISPIPDLT